MKIGVDAGCLGITDERLKVGVYQIAKNLFIELSKIDKKNKYFLYSFYPIEKSLLQQFGSNTRNIIVRPIKGWMKIWLPFQLMKDKPEIFLAFGQAIPTKIPFFSRNRTIVLFYDLAFERFPDFYLGSYKKLHKQSVYSAKNADAIIAISQKTKEDLVTLYHASEMKIIVSYPGTDKKFGNKLKDSGQIRMITNKPYFLFVGAMKPIKNIPEIIKGFAEFLRKTKSDYQLFLVGGDKWLDPEIENVLRKVSDDIKQRIKFLGFVSEETLVSLYQHATAFVSPSWYEGFGLPLLEALAAGCPVIASTAGSIPEIVGDGGILIYPNDYREIGEAMITVIKKKGLRKKLIEKGKKRAKNFSWEKFAEDVLKTMIAI